MDGTALTTAGGPSGFGTLVAALCAVIAGPTVGIAPLGSAWAADSPAQVARPAALEDVFAFGSARAEDSPAQGPVFTLRPVGWVRKADGTTTIEIDDRYRPALLGVDQLDALWVLYWFDRHDTPEGRSVLQVHPRGDPEQPLRGVFATRSPFRPNLIALSRVRVLAVRGNIIEIDGIDAYPDTPVLDLKP